MPEVLEAYRCTQPLVEKRHELLKMVLEFVGVIVHAVVEREIRGAMKPAR